MKACFLSFFSKRYFTYAQLLSETSLLCKKKIPASQQSLSPSCNPGGKFSSEYFVFFYRNVFISGSNTESGEEGMNRGLDH